MYDFLNKRFVVLAAERIVEGDREGLLRPLRIQREVAHNGLVEVIFHRALGVRVPTAEDVTCSRRDLKIAFVESLAVFHCDARNRAAAVGLQGDDVVDDFFARIGIDDLRYFGPLRVNRDVLVDDRREIELIAVVACRARIPTAEDITFSYRRFGHESGSAEADGLRFDVAAALRIERDRMRDDDPLRIELDVLHNGRREVVRRGERFIRVPTVEGVAFLRRVGGFGRRVVRVDLLRRDNRSAVGLEGDGIEHRFFRDFHPLRIERDIRLNRRVDEIVRIAAEDRAQIPAFEDVVFFGRLGRLHDFAARDDRLTDDKAAAVGLEGDGVIGRLFARIGVRGGNLRPLRVNRSVLHDGAERIFVAVGAFGIGIPAAERVTRSHRRYGHDRAVALLYALREQVVAVGEDTVVRAERNGDVPFRPSCIECKVIEDLFCEIVFGVEVVNNRFALGHRFEILIRTDFGKGVENRSRVPAAERIARFHGCCRFLRSAARKDDLIFHRRIGAVHLEGDRKAAFAHPSCIERDGGRDFGFEIVQRVEVVTRHVTIGVRNRFNVLIFRNVFGCVFEQIASRVPVDERVIVARRVVFGSYDLTAVRNALTFDRGARTRHERNDMILNRRPLRVDRSRFGHNAEGVFLAVVAIRALIPAAEDIAFSFGCGRFCNRTALFHGFDFERLVVVVEREGDVILFLARIFVVCLVVGNDDDIFGDHVGVMIFVAVFIGPAGERVAVFFGNDDRFADRLAVFDALCRQYVAFFVNKLDGVINNFFCFFGPLRVNRDIFSHCAEQVFATVGASRVRIPTREDLAL